MSMPFHRILNGLRFIGPIATVCAVIGIGVFVYDAPLVLVVVLACLFAIVEYVILTRTLRAKRAGRKVSEKT